VPRTAAELVRACRHGDRDAWNELLDQYGRLIWAVPLRLGAREEEAEEIFQRTWVVIVEKLHGLRQPQRLSSWIATTARHQTYQLFEENGRHRRTTPLDDAVHSGTEPAVEADVHRELERLELLTALDEALDRLDERCRKLLGLLFFTDPRPNYQTIAESTGLAVGSIGPIRSRCLHRLQKQLEKVYHRGPETDH